MDHQRQRTARASREHPKCLELLALPRPNLSLQPATFGNGVRYQVPLSLALCAAPSPLLRVRLVSNDPAFRSALKRSFERASELDVIGHFAPEEDDVVVIDADSVRPASDAVDTAGTPLTIVAAGEIDGSVQAYGAGVGALAYLKKGPEVSDIAALVVELVSIGQRPR